MTGECDLTGRTVVVTGGAGLIGREYARALTRAGACVVLTDNDSARLEEAAAETERPDLVWRAVADITDEQAVATLIGDVVARRGRIDGLVNNAAINPQFDAGRAVHDSSFEQFPLDEWNRALAVNLTGMFLCARAVAPVMRRQGSGSIVNVASTYGMVGPDQRLYAPEQPGAPQEFKPVSYSVTKSGVIGFTRYLATYFSGTGIRVNTLSPGGVHNAQSDEFIRRYSARTPLGRMAERHEYNGALLFLLSDASSYMTGANLVVDGGWTSW